MVAVTKRLAILVGGGPAPGINSVIGAATIRGRLEGVEVVGIRDGFEWIMQGNIDRGHAARDRRGQPHPLPRRLVHRHRPRQSDHDPKLLESSGHLAAAPERVACSITIGGDDTAFSAMKLEEQAAGRIHVVHVPKTIDNDLDLPPHVDTFGFQTARHLGVEIVKNLMVDAKTTSRWYFVIAMGRKAGHLALGMGKAAGATLTLIPEEFAGRKIKLKAIVDTLVGAIIKRLSYGPPRRRRGDRRRAGARSSIRRISRSSHDVERDAHGHVRLAEVNIGEILKTRSADAAAASSGSRRRSPPRTSATSCAAPTRCRSTWSTRATSATARRSTCSAAATPR